MLRDDGSYRCTRELSYVRNLVSISADGLMSRSSPTDVYTSSLTASHIHNKLPAEDGISYDSKRNVKG